MRPNFVPSIDTAFGIIYTPNGTINTTTPLPYIFDSKEEFSKYLELAKTETYRFSLPQGRCRYIENMSMSKNIIILF